MKKYAIGMTTLGAVVALWGALAAGENYAAFPGLTLVAAGAVIVLAGGVLALVARTAP